MKNRSVSITGATGFVGGHLADAFHDAGWRVRGVVRDRTARALANGVEVVEASLFDHDALTAAFSGADVVVHCAGAIRAKDEHAFNRVNVDGTRGVVQAANRSAASQLILISSLAAAGPGTPERPRREDDPPAPVNAYGRSKLGGEEVLRREARIGWTILRPCAVYGVGDRGFLPLFRMAKRGWFVRPTPAAMSFTMIDVADLARAVLLAAHAVPEGQTLFVGHEQPHSTDDIMRTLASIYGRPYAPIDVPRPVVRATAAIGDLAWRLGRKFVFDSGRFAEFSAPGFVCSTERARDVLGFRAERDITEGFGRAARWYRETGWV